MEVLHEIMTEESYTRLKQQKENAFVRKNADYHHCPTPDCDNIVLCPQTSEGELRICDCFKCGQTSCLECGETPYHMSLLFTLGLGSSYAFTETLVSSVEETLSNFDSA